MSGTWVPERSRGNDAAMLTNIMVDSIDEAQRKIVAAGGRILTPYTPIGTSRSGFAIFEDPAGNRVGLYEEPTK